MNIIKAIFYNSVIHTKFITVGCRREKYFWHQTSTCKWDEILWHFLSLNTDTGPQCQNYKFSIQSPSTYCIWVYFGLWFASYWLKILLNHPKIMHMSIKCTTFKICCNLQWCKEVKSNWYVLTVQINLLRLSPRQTESSTQV